MSATVTLRRATGADDRSYAERLLTANDLPAAAVRTTPERFYVASAGGERVGVGGLETRGDAGLLRSVVVERARRGEGYGAALCRALEAVAERQGVERLYLLTTTASDFFARRGYVETDRETAPQAIRETRQFADRCPATATCMTRSLTE